ncbi:MAG: tetratricopeptide repeat protein [Gammaproteobacteria bacterium]|nr:tetratricopeptide repeat protein [Gammaproteobacteria bacterium]
MNSAKAFRLSSILTLAISIGCGAQLAVAAERHEQTVRELAYGSSLFHYFQDKNLAAITDLEVAKQRNRLQDQSDDGELLLGGLYYDYGLPVSSAEIFNNLLNEEISEDIRDRIWFNLARVHYEQEDFAASEDLLSRISGKLPAQKQAQKHHIQSSLLLRKELYEEAGQASNNIDSDSIWKAYAWYNLGVSLNAAGQHDQGKAWLTRLGSIKREDNELLLLQDKAQLALGITALQLNNNDQAIEHFSRISLSGPLTNKALLGSGWAWSRKEQPDKALNYWFTLRDKGELDTASVEASLTIAQAVEQSQNKAAAARFYQQAAARYDANLAELDGIILRIQQGELMQALHELHIVRDSLDDNAPQQLPVLSATPYLLELFASKSFQLEIQRYQELLDIRASLSAWQDSIPALQLMLEERRQSFENKKPLVRQSTDFDQLNSVRDQRNELAAEVQRIQNQQDHLALADEDETDYLDQLDIVGSIIEQLQDQRDLSEEQDKFRLFRGLLEYQIAIDFPRRLWQVRRELQLLDRALEQASESAVSLSQASELNGLKLDEFDQRINGQQQLILDHFSRSQDLIEQQQQHLNQMAVAAIDSRKQQLAQLRLSARYSAARLFDELAMKEPDQ